MITLQDRRVLVLGATGFIGRWVAMEASRAGARVTLAARDTARASAVAAAYGIRGSIAGVDVLDRGDLAALMRDVRPEVTFNLIGYGVDRRETDTTLADAINVDLVQRLLPLVAEVSARNDWPGLQLVHTGSALEYGMASGHLAEDTAVNPSTVYGRTKLAATQLVAGATATGLRAVTARLFTVYGPGEHDGRLLPSVLAARSATAAIPMTNGLQQRDFTYVGDVVSGLLRAAVQPVAPWPTVNLATGRLHTVRDFVREAERTIGLAPGHFKFGVLPTRVDEMVHDAVTVERLRQWLGWVPPTPIGAGVAATVAFLETHHGSAPS